MSPAPTIRHSHRYYEPRILDYPKSRRPCTSIPKHDHPTIHKPTLIHIREEPKRLNSLMQCELCDPELLTIVHQFPSKYILCYRMNMTLKYCRNGGVPRKFAIRGRRDCVVYSLDICRIVAINKRGTYPCKTAICLLWSFSTSKMRIVRSEEQVARRFP